VPLDTSPRPAHGTDVEFHPDRDSSAREPFRWMSPREIIEGGGDEPDAAAVPAIVPPPPDDRAGSIELQVPND